MIKSFRAYIMAFTLNVIATVKTLVIDMSISRIILFLLYKNISWNFQVYMIVILKSRLLCIIYEIDYVAGT